MVLHVVGEGMSVDSKPINNKAIKIISMSTEVPMTYDVPAT